MSTAGAGLVERLHGVDEELGARLRVRLVEVEAALRRAVECRDPFLAEAAGHLIRAGGQRLRPLLALVAAEFADRERPAVVAAAVTVELVHVATLYHDDVIDEATTRRGVPTANARWGNRVAVLVGDFLLTRAAQTGIGLGVTAVREQAGTLSRLVRGEVSELRGPVPGGDPLAHGIGVVADKSASLLALAVHLGARAAGVPPAWIEALTCYAEAFGIAFQLSDDVLDITADSARTGKEAGIDLRQGVATMPVLHALSGGGPIAAQIRTVLGGGSTPGPDQVDTALAALRESPALDRTRAEIDRYLARARSALTGLPDIPARRALGALTSYIAERAAG